MRSIGEARKALAPFGCTVEDRSEGPRGINWEIMPPEGRSFQDGGSVLSGLPCCDAHDVCERARMIVRGEIGVIDDEPEGEPTREEEAFDAYLRRGGSTVARDAFLAGWHAATCARDDDDGVFEATAEEAAASDERSVYWLAGPGWYWVDAEAQEPVGPYATREAALGARAKGDGAGA